jgi:hypothetical protein
MSDILICSELSDLNIRQFKLVSGEEIICLVTHDNDENYMIEKPFTVVPSIDSTYKLAPWFAFSSVTQFSLIKTSVVCSAEVDEDIKDSYMKYTLDYGSDKEQISNKESKSRYEQIIDSMTDKDKETIH